jgi:hypothetical protein
MITGSYLVARGLRRECAGRAGALWAWTPRPSDAGCTGRRLPLGPGFRAPRLTGWPRPRWEKFSLRYRPARHMGFLERGWAALK